MKVYNCIMEEIVVSTARTLVQINSASDRVLVLLGARVTQELSEASTQESIQILVVSTAGTGTGITEEPLEINQGAAGFTSTVNHTAEGTAGAVKFRAGFNILTGFDYTPVPEARIWVPPSGRLAMRFDVAPASATWTAVMTVGEIG